jgi:membrane protease subunit (stomatin/prohibitin family)
MALFDFIKKQFIDVIHWTEETPGTLAYRYPMQDMEIQNGAQLTVRESQLALFVDEGKVADAFGPGRYTLTTQTLPILTNLRNWDKLFQSPFKSDVIFLSTRQQLDQKWGTAQPITVRDAEFGMVRLRAYGIYSFRIVDPKAFYLQVAGTQPIVTVESLGGQLRSTIVSGLTDVIASSKIAFIDLAANQDELGEALRTGMAARFAPLGLELSTFVVENVSLPEDIQKILDKRIGMNVIGQDMQRFTQFEVANSIGTAAANPGGVAGVGAGLAAGMAMGQQMMNAINSGAGASAAGAAPAAAAAPVDPQAVLGMIEKLHDLKVKGILSDAEFDKKKGELLAKLG